jgi:hypothetical protein
MMNIAWIFGIPTSSLKNVRNMLGYTPVLEGESPTIEPNLPKENCKSTAIILDIISKKPKMAQIGDKLCARPLSFAQIDRLDPNELRRQYMRTYFFTLLFCRLTDPIYRYLIHIAHIVEGGPAGRTPRALRVPT